MPPNLLDGTLTDDLEATSLEEEEAAPDDEGETETEQEESPPSNPYAEKTKEEVDALIASAEARARQSEKDRYAAQEAQKEAQRQREQFQRDQQAAASIANGTLEQGLRQKLQAIRDAAIRAEREGGEIPEAPEGFFRDVISDYWTGLRNADAMEWANAANEWLGEQAGWRPPPELITKAAADIHNYRHGEYLKTLLAIAEARGEAKGEAKGRAARAEDEQVAQLERKNGRQPGPTGASGSTPKATPLSPWDQGISEEERRKRWSVHPETAGLDFPVR